MSNIIDKIQLSGVTYDIGGQGGSGVSVVEVTQAGYDALPTSAKTDTSKMYVITDAEAGDLTNYYTKTETNTLLNGKQATLVSGTNIKTINNESILGSGNIDIQGGGGGGKAIEAGRGISVTTGETADTVSFDLPISAGTDTYSVIGGLEASANTYSISYGVRTKAIGNSSAAFGDTAQAIGNYSFAGNKGCSHGVYSCSFNEGVASNRSSFAEGYQTESKGYGSHSEGMFTTASTDGSHTEGYETIVKNVYEHSSGKHNNSVSASTTFGDSGNTLFSVGNGTSSSARHNAFEIRQNGDIYLSSGGTDIKLQDHLGGGGSSINVVQTTGSSTTDVMSQAAVTNIIGDIETLLSNI